MMEGTTTTTPETTTFDYDAYYKSLSPAMGQTGVIVATAVVSNI